MTVKNVAGYDLMKLHLGALGTLGVIAAVNLKLLPRPVSSGGIAAGFPDLAGALAVADRLAASQLLPSAVNLLGQLPPPGDAVGDLRDAGLSVVVEGAARVVEPELAEIAAWCREYGGRANILDAGAAAIALDHAAGFPQTAMLPPDEGVLRLSVQPGRLGAALAHAASAAAARGLHGSWLCHASAGTIFLRLAGVDRDGGAALRAVQDDLVARWATVVVLGCATALKEGLAVWGAEPEGLALMGALKARFDPRNTLNPGRFIGRI